MNIKKALSSFSLLNKYVMSQRVFICSESTLNNVNDVALVSSCLNLTRTMFQHFYCRLSQVNACYAVLPKIRAKRVFVLNQNKNQFGWMRVDEGDWVWEPCLVMPIILFSWFSISFDRQNLINSTLLQIIFTGVFWHTA